MHQVRIPCAITRVDKVVLDSYSVCLKLEGSV